MYEYRPKLKDKILAKLKESQNLIFIVLGIISISCIVSIFYLRVTHPSKISESERLDTLNLYFWGDIPKFNPIHPDGLYIWWIQNLIWDRILSVDEQFVWSPAIAESWSFNSDRTELKLKIKKNLKWSSGREVNQTDFEFSYFFYKDDSLKAAIYEPILRRVKTLDYKDDILTLRLDPKYQSDPFYATHTYWSHIMSTVKLYPSDLKMNPYLGTGAYQVTQFSNRGQLALSTNQTSWFFDKFKSIKMPKKILVKTVSSDQKLKKLLDSRNTQKNMIILGRDVYALSEQDWFPVNLKTELVSLSFNLSKISIDQRKKIFLLLRKINDIEKLNLQFKNLKILKLDSYKNTVDELNVKLPSKIDVWYFSSEDEKWLTYLNEKAKMQGLQLNLLKVSQSVFNEKVFKKEYEIYVDTSRPQEFYPHYLSYHSKGDYNFKGWNDLQLDNDLEKLILELDPSKTKSLIQKIKNYVGEQYSEVPMFSYETSVLWTRNPCKPIQTQFQGLGLIYKAIICADTY